MNCRSRIRYSGVAYIMGLLLTTAGVGAIAQTQPDNTKVNRREPAQVTADQQPNNRSDLETTRQIRKAIVAEKSLSSYGHNVKVVTKGGKVTLSGPVRSEDEKKMVEAKATDIAGAGNVTNELTVKNTSATSSATPAAKPSKKKAGA